MNWLDLTALAVVVLATLSGFRRGLLAGVLSLVGLVAGAYLGARIAPALVGEASPWIPVVTLGCSVTCSVIGSSLGGTIGGWARNALWTVPPLHWLDSFGGLLLGAATGLALVWVTATAFLYLPGADNLRRAVQDSKYVSSLTEALPAESVMDALGKLDPFLTIVGPSSGVPEATPAVARDPDIRAARGSVVRLRGIACGIGIQGSGWVVRRGLVVTNAHVVAGIEEPLVDRGSRDGLRGSVVAFDPKNDLALVRVQDLDARPLPLGPAESGTPGAVLGFPANGPYTARPARLGQTASVTSRDAFGRLRIGRDVVTFRGEVEGGSSGGPVVDREGRVSTTVFAKRRASDDGYGVPNDAVRELLKQVGRPLATPCAD